MEFLINGLLQIEPNLALHKDNNPCSISRHIPVYVWEVFISV